MLIVERSIPNEETFYSELNPDRCNTFVSSSLGLLSSETIKLFVHTYALQSIDSNIGWHPFD